MVTGFIDEPEEQTIAYSEFLNTLDCFDGDLNYVNILVNQLIGDQIAFTNLTNLQTDVLANIVDASGRQIFSRQMQFDGYERQFIDLPYDLPCGIYIVVFSQDGIKQSQKIYL
jgi:hypothetical protein